MVSNQKNRSFFAIVKIILFVLKIIVHFPSISFVFSLNDRSVKSFVQCNRSLSKIVRSVKKNCFFCCSKIRSFSKENDHLFSKSFGKFVRSVKKFFKFV